MAEEADVRPALRVVHHVEAHHQKVLPEVLVHQADEARTSLNPSPPNQEHRPLLVQEQNSLGVQE